MDKGCKDPTKKIVYSTITRLPVFFFIIRQLLLRHNNVYLKLQLQFYGFY